MKSTIFVVFFIVFNCFSGNLAIAGSSCTINIDLDSQKALTQFKEAYNQADTNAIISWAISQLSYNAIIKKINTSGATCLSDFDKKYSVHTVVDEFIKTCQAGKGFVLDSISGRGVSELKGCGDIIYKKIDATAYFQGHDNRFELPLSLILIKDESAQYQLMMQIINYKILENAK